MGCGPLSRPALRAAGNIAFDAGPRRQPRLVAAWSVPGRRSASPSDREGPGAGQEIGLSYGRSPSSYSLATNATPSLGGVFLALGHDFGTQNPASRTLFSSPEKRGHRLFTSFLLPVSTTYPLGPLLTLNPSLILVRGPESEISDGCPSYFRHFLPPALAGAAGNASMPHNAGDLTIRRDNPIATPLACQATATSRKSPASAPLGRLLAPLGGLFCPLASARGSHDAGGA